MVLSVTDGKQDWGLARKAALLSKDGKIPAALKHLSYRLNSDSKYLSLRETVCHFSL